MKKQSIANKLVDKMIAASDAIEKRRTRNMRVIDTKLVKVSPNLGYALKVGGPHPYLSSFVTSCGDPSARETIEAKCTQKYHKPVQAVVITLADYRRLLKAAERTQE